MRKISLTGIILKGRYFILEQIGQGGQGSLYLARDLELGIHRAVKELPIERKREAKLMRILEHPSLPKMMDYAERGDFCYLIMEFVRGKSLGELLKEGKIFSLEEIVRIGIEAAEILAYLHTQKPSVYYGDLKPDNLMLTESGRLYMVDLGSAVFGYGDVKRICEGTVGYAAPEQFEGRVTAVSDVYALGKTLSALCGKRKVRYLLKTPEFGMFLMHCCRREEQCRYQDMDTVKKKLKSVLKRCGSDSRQNRMRRMLLWGSVFIAAAGMTGFFSSKPSLEASLTEITQHYYEEDFLSGNSAEQKKICRSAEQKLQALLKEYPDRAAQRKLLLLLALNGEIQGEEEHAAVYYEQLLLYDRNYGEAYGQYGLFLCRMGQQEESLRLWKRFCAVREEGTLEEPGAETEQIWKERLGDPDDERTEKQTGVEKHGET